MSIGSKLKQARELLGFSMSRVFSETELFH